MERSLFSTSNVGREQQPCIGASLVDPLLAAPRKEIHDRCPALSPSKGEGWKSWPAYGVQAVPREKVRGASL
ncbi:unnamed protein product [Spirodela intermedia]|uniref:Uncharacterized protein n=1 Tax=Spirodela intermedia TaxID=51605 RepID=A0A7I8KAJ0_SPIIN|nr:unnamed protein product [Spirodela intermedia]